MVLGPGRRKPSKDVQHRRRSVSAARRVTNRLWPKDVAGSEGIAAGNIPRRSQIGPRSQRPPPSRCGKPGE